MTVVLTYWGERGGTFFTSCLAQRLVGLVGPDKVIASLRATNPDRALVESIGCRIQTIRLPLRSRLAPSGLARGFADVMGFHAMMRRERPTHTIIAMNHLLAWPVVSRAVAGGSVGSNLIYVVHDAAPHPGDYGQRFQRFTQSRLLGAADRVVALSENVAQDVTAIDPEIADKLVVAPIEGITPLGRERIRHRAAGQPLKMLLLGRLIEYKGLALLRDALAKLPPDDSWTLTISGHAKADQAPLAQAMASLPNVTILSEWLSADLFRAQLVNHDILVCPYTEASQSGVLPEAMREGMPAIVTPVGGLAAQVGHGKAGIVCDGVDADSLARAMGEVIARPERLAELSEGAVRHLREMAARDPWPSILELKSGKTPLQHS